MSGAPKAERVGLKNFEVCQRRPAAELFRWVAIEMNLQGNGGNSKTVHIVEKVANSN